MAERPRGYGMTAELQNKKDAKFEAPLAEEAKQWLEAVVGDPVGEFTASGCENLRNGVILCKLINILQPGSIKKINESKMAFKMMENIGKFLDACVAYGVPKADLFQTVDLYESQNMPQVVNGIFAVGRTAGKKGFDGPILGPKESSENKREFTEEQLQEGKGVIGLQMGSNKGASQSGSTPYGLGRQIEKTNLKT